MDISPSPGCPAKLYAILLRLRPLQQGTLMPFSGEFVQAALLNWLRSAAPDVAAWLHEGKREHTSAARPRKDLHRTHHATAWRVVSAVLRCIDAFQYDCPWGTEAAVHAAWQAGILAGGSDR